MYSPFHFKWEFDESCMQLPFWYHQGNTLINETTSSGKYRQDLMWYTKTQDVYRPVSGFISYAEVTG